MLYSVTLADKLFHARAGSNVPEFLLTAFNMSTRTVSRTSSTSEKPVVWRRLAGTTSCALSTATSLAWRVSFRFSTGSKATTSSAGFWYTEVLFTAGPCRPWAERAWYESPSMSRISGYCAACPLPWLPNAAHIFKACVHCSSSTMSTEDSTTISRARVTADSTMGARSYISNCPWGPLRLRTLLSATFLSHCSWAFSGSMPSMWSSLRKRLSVNHSDRAVFVTDTEARVMDEHTSLHTVWRSLQLMVLTSGVSRAARTFSR